MAIRYKGYTPDGQAVSGSLPVESEKEAEELLWQSNLIITALERERPARLSQFLPLVYRQIPTLFHPKPLDLVSFARELTTMLEAGIPIHEALLLVQERIANPLLLEAIIRITRDIEEGGSLSEAIARHPSIFPDLYQRLVAVGEETGNLASALNQIADYTERQANLSKRVTDALRYPAVVFVLGLGAMIFLTSFTLPAVATMLKEFGGKLPFTARLLLGFTELANSIGQWVIAGLLAALAAAWLYFRTPHGIKTRDYLILSIPLIGRAARLTYMFRFTTSLSAMLAAGLALVEAIGLVTRVVGNNTIEEALNRIRERVLRGESLSRAISQEPVFPPVIPQMLAVAEQSGTITHNLGTLSKLFQRQAEETIASLTGMIEPTLIIVAGGGVGFIAITVMSSIYGVLGQIR